MSDHYREAYYKIEQELARVLAAFGCTNVDDVIVIAHKVEDAAQRAEERRTVAPDVDGRDFYELCQQYRHSREIVPHGHVNTVQAFDNLREYIKTGKLPWPSYQRDDVNNGERSDEPQG